MVQGLWESLQKGGDCFSNEARLDDSEKPDTRVVTIGLKDVIPRGAKKYITAYAKGYAKEAGWKVVNVRYADRYVRFEASRQD